METEQLWEIIDKSGRGYLDHRTVGLSILIIVNNIYF